MNIEFNNLSKSPLKKSFLQKIAKVTIARSGVFQTPSVPLRGTSPPWKGGEGYVFSISFANVSEKEIQKLNKIYRRKNMPTDVLSFAEYKSRDAIYCVLNSCDKSRRDAQPARRDKSRRIKSRPYKDENKNHTTLFLGEIILCYNNIAEYSKKNKLDLERELRKVIAHGVLHLLGFRHGKKMFEIQNPE
jgi:rRNA maturation RNase YbeY